MSKKLHDEDVAAERREIHDKSWMTECLTLFGRYNPAGMKVLDIGCGNGEASDLLKDKFQCQMSGLDYANAHLDRVRAKGYETIPCDMDDEAARQAVADRYRDHFDAAICLEVIEHIFNPDTLLSLAHSVLKPGGLLIVSTPNMAYIGYRLYSLFRGNLPAGSGHHISFFDARRLSQQLFLNSFDLQEMVHFGSGEFYLDRTIGLSNPTWRKVAVRTLFEAGLRLGPRSLRNSGLISISKKADISPVGLSTSFRTHAYARLSEPERQQVIKRLSPCLKTRFFDEHPVLCSFIRQEALRLKDH